MATKSDPAGTRDHAARAGSRTLSMVCLVALLAGGSVVGARAAVPMTPTVTVSPDPLTPITSGGCVDNRTPCYQAYGMADPGALVVVQVTDDFQSAPVTVALYASTADDPGMGLRAGSWSTSPNVTDLGAHGTKTSLLHFSAYAVVDGVRSGVGTYTAQKVSATPRDVTSPDLIPSSRAPRYWTSIRPVVSATGGSGFDTSSQATIGGYLEDNSLGAAGIASEIADCAILISEQTASGELILVDEYHPILRRGTRAYYGQTIDRRDFLVGQTYEVDVQATDAWGHQSEQDTSYFTVLP